MDWRAQIDLVTKNFKDSFQSLSEDELNWKPDAKTWSVAQNIHHLIVINQTYYPIIKSVRDGNYQLPWIARWKFMVNFFGNFILKSVTPDRRKKIKTFPKWEPSASGFTKEIIHEFELHQQELKSTIEASRHWADNGTIISSPANKNIVYTLKCAFDIIVTHEFRHWEQAKEVNALRIKMNLK